MRAVREPERALERSRRYAQLAQGFWRPRADSLLQHEYDRLFCHRTTILCPIYEVEYDENRAVSQGAILADIAGFYRAFALELAVNERPDHLALELEFMSFLAYKEALALQNNLQEQAALCRDAQKKFLEAHVGRWAHVFATKLLGETQVEFYAELATALQEFISAECQALGAKPHVLQAPPAAEEVSDDVRCPLTRL